MSATLRAKLIKNDEHPLNIGGALKGGGYAGGMQEALSASMPNSARPFRLTGGGIRVEPGPSGGAWSTLLPINKV